MKTLVSFVITIYFTAIFTWPSWGKSYPFTPDECSSGRDIVFIIHGIWGDRLTFGNMDKVLESKFNTKDACFESVYLHYDTGNDDLDVYDFAKTIQLRIEDYFFDNYDIMKNDRISFVTHSQGGIVTLLWLINSNNNAAGFSSYYSNRVKSVMTLSTPFWGTSLAKVGIKILDDWGLKPVLKVAMGTKEMHGMKYGSDLIYDTVKLLANTPEKITPLFNRLKILNVAGVFKRPIKWRKIAHWNYLLESDTAVPVASARMDILLTNAIVKDYSSSQKFAAYKTKATGFGKFRMIKGSHLKMKPFFSTGVAHLPKSCIDLVCDHPAWPLLQAQLGDTVLPNHKKWSDTITSFRLNLEVKLPDGSYVDPKDIKVKMKKGSGKLFYDGKKMDRLKGRGGIHASRFLLKGAIKKGIAFYDYSNDLRYKEKMITLTITAPGMKTRVIETNVRSSWSTFVLANLVRR